MVVESSVMRRKALVAESSEWDRTKKTGFTEISSQVPY